MHRKQNRGHSRCLRHVLNYPCLVPGFFRYKNLASICLILVMIFGGVTNTLKIRDSASAVADAEEGPGGPGHPPYFLEIAQFL